MHRSTPSAHHRNPLEASPYLGTSRGHRRLPAGIWKPTIALAILAVTVATWVGSASAISKSQAFSLLAIDNGKGQPFNGFMFQRAPAAGDQFAISENPYRWAGAKRGTKVGTDMGVGTFLTATQTGGSNMFTVQTNLSGGTILVSGIVAFKTEPTKFTLAITGGTGTYANARGYVNVRQLGGNKTNLDFHLIP